MKIALIVALAALQSMAQTDTAELNKNYKEAFFGYLDNELSITQKLVDYRSATQAVPSARRTVTQRSAAVLRVDRQISTLNEQIKLAERNEKTLTDGMLALEDQAKLELDEMQEGVDTVTQLRNRQKQLDGIEKNYLDAIKIEERKIARVIRSPEYQFYIKEEEIQSQRVARLGQDIRGIQSEITVLEREISRLNRLKSLYESRIQTAKSELPALKKKMDDASADLEQAKKSGDERRIQVAETNFHQAFTNYRRADLERNDSELGLVDTLAKKERKENLKNEKSVILADSKGDHIKAKQKLAQTRSSLAVYKKQKLDDPKARVKKLTVEKAKVVEKNQKIEVIATKIIAKRQEISQAKQQVASLKSAGTSLNADKSKAEGHLNTARVELKRVIDKVTLAKNTYNKSIQDMKLSYQNTIDQQTALQTATGQ